MSIKIKNRRSAKSNYDPSSVDSNSYNDAAGGRKITNVGHHLKPMKIGAAAWSTDASVARKIGKGISIAVFAKADGAITIGEAGVLSLAAGVVDVNGCVGIPVLTGQWIYLNTFTYDHIITSSNDLLVYIIEDDTYIINTP